MSPETLFLQIAAKHELPFITMQKCKGRKASDARAEWYRELRRQGMLLREISELTGRDTSSISMAVIRLEGKVEDKRKYNGGRITWPWKK